MNRAVESNKLVCFEQVCLNIFANSAVHVQKLRMELVAAVPGPAIYNDRQACEGWQDMRVDGDAELGRDSKVGWRF